MPNYQKMHALIHEYHLSFFKDNQLVFSLSGPLAKFCKILYVQKQLFKDVLYNWCFEECRRVTFARIFFNQNQSLTKNDQMKPFFLVGIIICNIAFIYITIFHFQTYKF